MKKFIRNTTEFGGIMIYNVVVIFIFSLLMLGVLSYAAGQLRLTTSSVNREQAFQIAEAGANYYQWRLAHFPTDFWDGNASTTPGPYVKSYFDKDTNQKIGEFSLTITPPAVGSTVVTIKSTGYTTANPNTKRTVTVRYGVPSLAKYAFLTNNDVWIGTGESVNGQMHANGGIRFDGTGNAPIASAKSTYTCQNYHGCSPAQTKNGIWGTAPTSTQAFWQYPVPNVDFSALTSNLSSMKSSAQSGGLYLAPSNAQGYSLVFNSNATISVYRVNSLRSHATGWDVANVAHNEDIDYNGRTLLSTQAMPTNGIVYVEDNLWVEGTVNGRVNVAAAKLPYNAATAPSIMVPNNLVYLAKDGNHSLGLIAQKNFLVTYYAPNNLEIDAAIVAQNGSAQMYYFPGNIKNNITIYGALASFGVWTWTWVSGGAVTSGYQNTSTVYDASLLYSPPPSFPLTTDGYQQLSWFVN